MYNSFLDYQPGQSRNVTEIKDFYWDWKICGKFPLCVIQTTTLVFLIVGGGGRFRKFDFFPPIPAYYAPPPFYEISSLC